jgi:hypothetical protein
LKSQQNRILARDNRENNQKTVENAPSVRQRMNFTITDGGHGGQGHIKPVKPSPALDEVKTGCAAAFQAYQHGSPGD